MLQPVQAINIIDDISGSNKNLDFNGYEDPQSDASSDALDIEAPSVILVEADRGQILYDKNAKKSFIYPLSAK